MIALARFLQHAPRGGPAPAPARPAARAAAAPAHPPAPTGEGGGAAYLSIRRVHKHYGAFAALQGIDLEIERGEFVCFLGPSGCGKTTLLRAIAGLEPHSSGEIWQAGREISRLPAAQRDYGIVFQSYALFPHLTAAENVAYGLVSQRQPRALVQAKVQGLLDTVGLPGSGGKYPAQMSGGQQQRVALARALAMSPGLLLLDEPLSALDATVRVRLRSEIRALQQRLHVTTIMVTHDQEEALSVADRVVVMNHGAVEQVGTPTDIYLRPATPFVAEFIGKANRLPVLAAGRGLLLLAGQPMHCPQAGPLAAGQEAVAYLRPEDCRVIQCTALPVAGAHPLPQGEQVWSGRVEHIEFLGSHCLAHVEPQRLPGRRLQLQLSMADWARLDVQPGRWLQFGIPPERLTVFAVPATPGAAGVNTSVIPSLARAGARPPLRQRAAPGERLAHAALLLVLALLATFLLGPLLALLAQAFAPAPGAGQGAFGPFAAYLRSPALLGSLYNSVWVSLLVTALVIPPAFGFAYALTRTCMVGKGLLRAISLLPLLAPSLLSAISMVYWFGNQGVLRGAWQALGLGGLYGAPGVVLAQCFATFPHALMILVTALAVGDQRLYEAATALGAGAARRFWTVTVPAARYGLISAALVVFTLVITDFGIPKVIGGNFSMLATDVFKLVIGQQDFQRGAVVALLLLAPAVLTYLIDLRVHRRQAAVLTARAVALQPRPHAARDRAALAGCGLLAALMLAMFGMAVFASLARFWPYQLQPTLAHYTSGLVDAGVETAIWHSIQMAACTAVAGPALVFAGAYLLEKTRGLDWARPLLRLLAMLPMAVPGLVLGLGYIFFFNAPGNPLNGLYQTMALMVLCTVVHYYTTGHMTLMAALKAIDGEFEAVGASLKVPQHATLRRVTLPLCLPALLEVSRYFFIAAMTTISAVVFLYSPETRLGAVAILNLDEAGDTAAAAAMAVLIALVSCVATLLYQLLGAWMARRTQRWRQRS